jgi:hypothetical protein
MGPEEVKRTARLRKALMTGLQSPDADNFDIEKVARRSQEAAAFVASSRLNNVEELPSCPVV